jgi:tRNA A37 threonylcarbamoyladenosine dehydratase
MCIIIKGFINGVKMSEYFTRTELLIGKDAVEKLKNSSVLIFGLGGVGSYICESLVRAGIGHMTIVDNDTVNESNINRQIIATTKTIGRLKTEVMTERLKEINPDIDVKAFTFFYLPENADKIDFSKYNYIIDAIDTITAKIDIIIRAKKLNIPVISCMGTGNKINPLELKVSDIFKTDTDPIAKVLRKKLKENNIKDLKVVYSKETPIKPKDVKQDDNIESDADDIERPRKRITPGSISFVPSVAGLLIASEVVKDLIKTV